MTHTAARYRPSDVIAHRGPMLLIDEIAGVGEDWLECLVHHRQPGLFADTAGNTPSWVGLEYMCQAIAALEGTQRLAKKLPIALGFVLGTRCLQTQIPYFRHGQTIHVRVDEEMKNQTSLGVYTGKILGANAELLANARIKAVMPEDPAAVIYQTRGSP